MSNAPRKYTDSVDDVAEHFKVHKNTVYNWLATTDLPHRRVQGTLRFNLGEVDEWAASQSPPAAAAR